MRWWEMLAINLGLIIIYVFCLVQILVLMLGGCPILHLSSEFYLPVYGVYQQLYKYLSDCSDEHSN